MKYEVVALFFLNQPDGKFRLVTFNVRGIVLLVGTPILQYLKRDNNINRWVDIGPILGRHDHVGPLLPPTPVLAGVPGCGADLEKPWSLILAFVTFLVLRKYLIYPLNHVFLWHLWSIKVILNGFIAFRYLTTDKLV